MKAALYIEGKVVIADSHLEAFRMLSEDEREKPLVSGTYDPASGEFISDMPDDHFFNKQIYLIRHGLAYQNLGDNDPEIQVEGLAQAARICDLFRRCELSGFVGIVSPMLRCLRTALVLHDGLGLPFRVCPGVMETPAFLAENESVVLKNRHRGFPQFEWKCKENWQIPFESKEAFLARVRSTLKTLPEKSIVVTHFGFICNSARVALCDKKADGVMREGIPPASVIYINRHSMDRMSSNEAILQDRQAALR